MSKLYDTLWFNCTTKAFDVVECVLGKDPRFGLIRDFSQRRIPSIAKMKANALGGISAADISDDLSLQVEAQGALERTIIAQNGQIYPPGMKRRNRERIDQTIKALNLDPTLAGRTKCEIGLARE